MISVAIERAPRRSEKNLGGTWLKVDGEESLDSPSAISLALRIRYQVKQERGADQAPP